MQGFAHIGVEGLESRVLMSGDAGSALPTWESVERGTGPVGLPIRLDLVALHEFGHSLGLEHNEDPTSIMGMYYDPNYDAGYFLNDPVVQDIRNLFSPAKVRDGTTPWKDHLDAKPGDGVVEVSYSFMRDGAALDQGTSNLFATFDRQFGKGKWEPVFAQELNRWSLATEGTLQFVPFGGAKNRQAGRESGVVAMNAAGEVQNDSRFGDIRIGGHSMDGVGAELAHAYYPPPNGGTVAGDTHFDTAEGWVLGGAAASQSHKKVKPVKSVAVVGWTTVQSPLTGRPTVYVVALTGTDAESLAEQVRQILDRSR